MRGTAVNFVFDFGAVLFSWKPRLLVQTHFPNHATTQEQTAALAHAVFGHADWHDFDRGLLTVDEVTQRGAKRLKLDDAALRALIEGVADHLQPMPETLAVLKQLRSLRAQQPERFHLYFLSNMPTPYARVLEQKHSFLQWFEGGIFSADVQHIKPEEAIYALLEQRHALDVSQTVLIDDLAANVAAAKARGWHGIQFSSAAQLRDDLRLLLAHDGLKALADNAQ
jgi:putative hydrolase of the HAD superfamily